MNNTQFAQKQIKLIESSLKELALKTEDTKKSEFFKNYLEIINKFYNYSLHNQLLIYFQKPKSTRVAGFKQWNSDFKRTINKGEHGISILIPLIANFDNENHKLRYDKIKKSYYCDKCRTYKEPAKHSIYGFRGGIVFDISQTKGEELPDINIDINGDNFNYILDILKDFCSDNNIKLEFKDFGINYLYGYSKGGDITVSNNKEINTQVNTLLHEIAHEIIHNKEDRLKLDKTLKETQAESVAYIVSKHFKLEPKSYNYLALYNSDYKIIMSNLKVVSGCSRKIIVYIENKLKNKKPEV